MHDEVESPITGGWPVRVAARPDVPDGPGASLPVRLNIAAGAADPDRTDTANHL